MSKTTFQFCQRKGFFSSPIVSSSFVQARPEMKQTWGSPSRSINIVKLKGSPATAVGRVVGPEVTVAFWSLMVYWLRKHPVNKFPSVALGRQGLRK
ncbi:hypothetical protein Peur_015164 [Populus x canadensis]